MGRPFDHFVSNPTSIFISLKMSVFERVIPRLFYPTTHFCQFLGLSWEVTINCHELPKIKKSRSWNTESKNQETEIQASKLEELSSINTAYIFTKKNKSKYRHITEYFMMDQKVQDSIHSGSPSFLCISILFNLTFSMCIKHTKNVI